MGPHFDSLTCKLLKCKHGSHTPKYSVIYRILVKRRKYKPPDSNNVEMCACALHQPSVRLVLCVIVGKDKWSYVTLSSAASAVLTVMLLEHLAVQALEPGSEDSRILKFY